MRVSYTRNLRSNTDLRIQSVINILTEAYDYVKLTEAVPYSVAKEYLEIERSPEAEARIKEIFSKLKSLPNARQLDKRGYRIAFPYAEDSTEFEIQAVLEPYNFSIKDYKDGVALDTKNNREISLGKALNIVSKKEPDAKELIDRYAAIKGKGATSKDEDLMIIFSSAKYDLAGMSTGRNLPEFGDWDSCMNVIKGGNSGYVKLDIREGSIICYLTTVSDTNLQRALGRVLIKPYLNTEDKKDVVLYAELKTYGKIPNPEKFMDEVDNYMEKTQKLSGSYERLGCLYPDSERDEIEGKETIRTRALKKLEDEEELTKEEFISLPLEIKRKNIDDVIKSNLELYGYIFPIKYSFASQGQKRNIIKIIIKNKERIYPFIFNGAPKDSKKEIIDYKLDDGIELEKYEFEAATQEQKEKYIGRKLLINDMTSIANFYRDLYNYELKAATPKQKEKYINFKIENNKSLRDYEFEAATPEQREKYIDSELSLERGLQKYELKAATLEQKEKYIDWKLSKGYELFNPELELATSEQKEKYIDYRLNAFNFLEGYEFKAATSEQKEKYINWKLSIEYELDDYELEAATKEQKEINKYYAKE